jgi:hypothetical protein
MAAIADFESNVWLPAIQEICESPALRRDYTPTIARPQENENVDELISALAGALRRPHGPALVISNTARPPGISAIGGHYVVAPFYVGELYVSPGVIFWMRFNNKLHVFDHRYDDSRAQFPIGEVTRHDIQNHVLRSFDFYKLCAFSDQPFPGYGRG